MTSKVRSSTGCWTCRLRRKKCDETKPSCHRCRSSKLQLKCEGYSDKPIWMDKGELEKVKAEETKRLVRGSLSSGIKRRKIQPRSPVRRALSDNFSLSSSDSPCPMIRELSESSLRPSDVDIGNDLPCPDLLPCDNDELESSLGPGEVDVRNGPPCPDPVTYDNDKTHCGTLPTQQRSQQDATQLIDSYNFSNPVDESHDLLFWSQYLNQSSSESSSAASSSCCQSRFSHRPSTSDEADLLLHYLDFAFEKQFPFVTKSNRGWLYMAITRTDITFWATLSLASHYQGSVDSLSCFYNNLAILELRKNISVIEFMQARQLDMTLECCFAMVQLMFLEKLKGNFEACKMHMLAACNLLTDFQSAAVISGTSELSLVASGTDKINSPMLQLVITTLRWFDILFSCSLRVQPSMSAQLLEVLEIGSTKITDKINYQGRVVASLAKVLELDHWRTATANMGRLSVVELVKRATAIENSILSDPDLIGSRAGGQGLSNPECVTGETLTAQVNRIFLSTAMVYLQIIVAGSHREVPEISKGVSDTLGLFRSLSGHEMLSQLAWPFCVAGCLATGDDRAFVASLADEATSQTDCTMSMKWASTIIRECWRLWDEEIYVGPDWTSAMKSLGCQFILF